MTLDQLPIGKCACVVGLSENCAMRGRLQDLGVMPGGDVRAVMRSPLGDPTAYLICGAVIALRREDALCVEVRMLK